MKLAKQMANLSQSADAFDKVKEKAIQTIKQYAETGYREAVVMVPNNLCDPLIEYLESEGFITQKRTSHRTDTVDVTW